MLRLPPLWSAALLCFACVSPVALRAEWRRLDAAGFSVLSDSSPRDIERFALDYAAFRQTTHEFFGRPGRRAPRTIIVLFKKEKDFAQHAPKSDRRDSKTVVFTTEIDSGAILALPLSGDRRRALELAFEFDTIWMLRRYGYFLPTWMAQGAGQVLSTLRIEDGQRVIGRGDDRFHGALNYSDLIRWDRFFEINPRSPEYTGPSATGQFHRQAWALMHWVLLPDEGGPQRFQELARRLKQEPPRRAVEQVMNVADLQRERLSSLQRNPPRRRLPFDEAATRASWSLRAADPLEVQLYLADLLAVSGKPAAAEWAVMQALATAPELAVVQEAAARRALRQRQFHEAVDHYRRAIDAGSENPVAYVVSAQARLNESTHARRDRPGSGLPQVMSDVIAELRRALELDPGNPEAFHLLGRAFFLAPTLSEGAVEELSGGVGPGAAGARTRLYRAAIRWMRLQDLEGAKEDFIVAAETADAPEGLREEARAQLEQLRLQQTHQAVEARLRQRDIEGARAAWAAGQAESTDPAAQEEYQRMRQWMERQAERISPGPSQDRPTSPAAAATNAEPSASSAPAGAAGRR